MSWITTCNGKLVNVDFFKQIKMSILSLGEFSTVKLYGEYEPNNRITIGYFDNTDEGYEFTKFIIGNIFHLYESRLDSLDLKIINYISTNENQKEFNAEKILFKDGCSVLFMKERLTYLKSLKFEEEFDDFF